MDEKNKFLNNLNLNDENTIRIWSGFYDLTQIPRPSKNEKKVADYLEKFANEKTITVERDKYNNILLRLPSNNPQIKGVLLQGHSDMVCVKGSERDPSVEGVSPVIDETGEWVKAQNTSLGADNGIGVAALLSLLEDKEFVHGPLGILITTDEETGLNGAKNLKFDLSKYKYLINCDSEDWGEATIGCAGGEDVIITLNTKMEAVKETAIKISVSGLKGGHSALAIAEVGRANAIKLLAGVISDLVEQADVHLVSFNGGTARNVIPSEAEAVITFGGFTEVDSENHFSSIIKKTIQEYDNEENIAIEISKTQDVDRGCSIIDTEKILDMINDLPHGVIKWVGLKEEKPQTSTNLAMIRTSGTSLEIVSMNRSSFEKESDEVAKMQSNIAFKHGARLLREGKYPAWEPDYESKIVKHAQKIFRDIWQEELLIEQTHGGLECGIIKNTYPNIIEAISLGPTITGAHSINERVNISSVEKFYTYLKALIRDLQD
ncbi:beta-Ala-His dipeptidase [Candidatus Woesebacteria bacterium]|nr:MAG: beta-Ala-His dipeptidase [Candidatus Woesebacteria bacterium]